MGYAISWLVVSGRDRQSLLDELGLQSTGNLGEVLDFKITGHALPDGAYLLVMDQCEHPFVSEKRLAQISLNCKVLACSIEEHVMYAYATYWTDGKNLWNMKHEGDTDKGRNDVTVSGTPPDSFRAIRDDYAERQLGDPRVDWYFEMPLAMAKLLTGFKHDETNPGLDGSYEELAELSGSTKSWWKFGR